MSASVAFWALGFTLGPHVLVAVLGGPRRFVLVPMVPSSGCAGLAASPHSRAGPAFVGLERWLYRCCWAQSAVWAQGSRPS
jgi:hypothetical protein